MPSHQVFQKEEYRSIKHNHPMRRDLLVGCSPEAKFMDPLEEEGEAPPTEGSLMEEDQW